MIKWQDTVLVSGGGALAGASVYVYLKGTTTLATVYSDNGITTQSNPLTTSATGFYSFYAADGRYDLSIQKTGYTTVNLTDISVDDAADASTINATTLTATTGTIATLNSTNGTIATLNATTATLTSATIPTLGSTTATVSTLNATTVNATGQVTLGGAANSESVKVLNVASQVNRHEFYGSVTGANAKYTIAGSDANISLDINAKGSGGIFLKGYGGASTIANFNTQTSADVNYLQITSSATTTPAKITAVGTDTNISISYVSKGTGSHAFFAGASPVFNITATSSPVNFINLTSANTGNPAYLFATGTDANVGLILDTKGTGGIRFATGGSQVNQFTVAHAASAVNYIQAQGAATAGSPNLSVLGTDANISLTLAAKGTGNILSTLGALGYGAGAGGTVTKLTSRTTGVTINKPSGQITLFSAAGSTTAASFTVTNSYVGAQDTISISQASGTNLYVTSVTTVSAGSFVITFYTTGGVSTDSPVFNFNVTKGSSA